MNKLLEKLIKDASSQLEAQDFAKAIKLYKQALKLQANNAATQMGLAMAYNCTGKSTEALKLLQSLLATVQTSRTKEQAQLDPATLAEILAQTGIALQQLGQLDPALVFYRQANSLYPSDALTHRISQLTASNMALPIDQLIYKAQQHQANKQTDEAMLAYKAALQINPDSDRAQHGLGNILREQGDLQNALFYIQQAIIMQPEIAEYHNTLGMLFQQKGEFEKAITFHRRAINLDPQYAAAFCNLGVALKNLNRSEEAITAYRQALQINPKMPEAHNNLGNLLRALGDLVGAKASLKQALKLRPDYADAKRNLDEVVGLAKVVVKKARVKSVVKISHEKIKSASE